MHVTGESMKALSWLVSILLAFSACCAAQTAAPNGNTDSFGSTLENYRVWSNATLDISWTIPKGLFARAEQVEQWRKRVSQNPQAVHQFLAEFEKRDADDRQHGILLRGDDADPQHLGVAENNARDASNNFNAPNIFTPGGVSETFMILGRRVVGSATPAELLKAQTDKMHQQDPSLNFEIAAEPVDFSGIPFAYGDWTAYDKLRQEQAYYRSYITVRNGFELIWTFRANSKKALEENSKSMESISSTRPLAAK